MPVRRLALTLLASALTVPAFAVPARAAAPNLAAVAIARPPAAVPAGGTFTVTETTANQGDAPAAASLTRFYISADQLLDDADIRLAGARAVGPLAPDASSGGSTEATIPDNAPVGRYYVLACADDTAVVAESDETDNCQSSANRIRLTAVDRPDLLVDAVSEPPTARPAGGSFVAGDRTANVGVSAAPASRTTYHLSADAVVDPADVLLTGARPVPPLASGQRQAGARVVGIPAATAPGEYFLLACADGPNLVLEAVETNCLAAAGTVQVVPAAD